MHQPNFIPYMGFFQKMKEVELFVILKEVQFEKNGWQNRFKYQDKWYTMATNKGLEPIKYKKYVNFIEDWEYITAKLPKLCFFDGCLSPSLYTMNNLIIRKSADYLGIKCKIEEDHPTLNTGTMRLIDLCMKFKADTYLSGISGTKYLDLELFKKFGIKVIFQDEKTMDKRSLVELL